MCKADLAECFSFYKGPRLSSVYYPAWLWSSARGQVCVCVCVRAPARLAPLSSAGWSAIGDWHGFSGDTKTL